MKRIFFGLNRVWALMMVIAATLVVGCNPTPDGPEPVGPPVVDENEGNLPLISTSPLFVTNSTTEDVVVTVNTAGTSMEGFSGEMYAHTGVLTDKSASPSDWKYVKHEWTQNSDDCKLVPVSGKANLWQLTITGGPRAFYGVAAGETITKLAFVFRSADGTKELKDNGNDIFVELAEPGLDVMFTYPTNGAVLEYNTIYTVRASAKEAEKVELYQNGELVEQTTSNDIAYKFTTSEYADYLFEAKAIKGGEEVVATLRVSVLGDAEQAPLPEGIGDGVTVADSGTEATFVLYAPGKERVVLLGDFNDFAVTNRYNMKRDGDYFWTSVEGLKPDTEYIYQYLVDGTIKVADPYSTKVLDPWNDKWIADSTYPNLREYPAESTTEMLSAFSTTPDYYNWQVVDFQRPNKNSLVIYELLVRDFTSEGTIDAVTAKLDYLDNLGVNAIELLPIQEFEGNDSWGYNPSFYFAPDKAYGTPEDYKEFIDECHKRGIAVILDVVFNHATGQFPWMRMWMDSDWTPSNDNPFFNKKAKHPFNVFSDFNHEYPKTRSYFKEVLAYWLTEYKVDGFRFDLSKGFTQKQTNDAGAMAAKDDSRIAILKDYAAAIREVSPDAYIILEHFAAEAEENVLAADGMMLWRNMNYNFAENAMGWYDANNKSNFASISAYNRVGYAESHDEQRIAFKAYMYGAAGVGTNAATKASSEVIAQRLAGSYALAYLSPYPKMMWQFGELAYDFPINSNDQGVVGSSGPDGEEYRTHSKPIPWELGYHTDANRMALYEDLCKIISFRTDNPEIFSSESVTGELKCWRVGDSAMGSKTLVLANTHGGVIVVANMCESGSETVTTTVDVPQAGSWTNLLTGETVQLDSSWKVSLAPHEFIVLTKVN